MANETGVRPALTAEEWKWVREGSTLSRTAGGGLNPADHVAAMAQHNYRLPDGDPRKITREDVKEIDAAAFSLECEWGEDAAPELRAIAAKLAALLPPHA